MKSLVRAELLKLRTTRMSWIAVAFVLLTAAAMPPIGVLLVTGGPDPEALVAADLAEMVRAPVRAAGGALLVLGLLASASEYRFRTVVTTRLVAPHAGRVLASKLLALGLVGLLTGVALVVLTLVSSGIALGGQGVPFEPFEHSVPRLALTVPLLLAVQAVIGVAVGELLRNTTTAVGVAFAWVFVVEGIVPSVTGRPYLIDWLPGGLVQGVLRGAAAHGPDPAGALVALVAYAGLMVTLVLLVGRRREV